MTLNELIEDAKALGIDPDKEINLWVNAVPYTIEQIWMAYPNSGLMIDLKQEARGQ